MAPQQVTSLLCLTIVTLKYGIALFHALQGLQQDLTAYLSSLLLVTMSPFCGIHAKGARIQRYPCNRSLIHQILVTIDGMI